jgi:GTP-binding protein
VKVAATFVTSAAAAGDFPRDGLAQIALVGRSNVGKSSLINALARRPVARTSAAPGKTRLANLYRIVRGSAAPLYVVDLPGYGYARGGRDAARAFDDLAHAFFARQPGAREEQTTGQAALLLVDPRHPGLPSDIDAWRWLRAATDRAAIVATKTDKLSRAERQRAIRQLEAVLEHPVLPVSAASGEGLDELWILIDSLANQPSSSRKRPRSSRDSNPGAASPPREAATAPQLRRK